MFLDAIENTGATARCCAIFAPSQVGNRAFEEWWGRMQRSAVSPGMARQLIEMIARDRSAAVLPDDPGPDAGHPPARRPLHPGRARSRGRRADPRGALHRVPRRRTPTAGLEAPALDDVEEFLTGRRRRRRDRPRAGDGDVHRHRRLHRARRAARRRPLARRCSHEHHDDRPHRARALAGHRGQDDRRRLPRHLRRSGPRGPLRARDRRRGRALGLERARRPAHRRVRARRRRRGRDRRPHRRARDGQRRGRARCSPRARSRTSSSARAAVRGPRPARAKGVPDEWRLYALER